jgi:tetratricopeptide (TPR) repeat protein
MKYPLFINCTVILLCFTPPIAAKSNNQISQIAQSVTVEIKSQNSNAVGSGVIVHRQKDVYTLVSNRHVVCGQVNYKCNKLPTNSVYTITTADRHKHRVNIQAVKLLENNLDLAILQFRSKKNYVVAQVDTSEQLKVDDLVYTAGYPEKDFGFAFDEGKAIAVVNKRLVEDNGGYTIVYSAKTLPGMSGSGVYNSKGQLVAIHGLGDQYNVGTELEVSDGSRLGRKIGYNRGIPVKWLLQSLRQRGINLSGLMLTSIDPTTKNNDPETADEYFITGFNKNVNPGDDALAGKKQAIQAFTTAIRLNPKYSAAYMSRAIIYHQLKELDKALTDYDQAIKLNPTYDLAYYNRANLKKKLKNLSGSLADYNTAIQLTPEFVYAYYNRGVLKFDNFGDVSGALNDFNKAIEFNPDYAYAYTARAILKDIKLNDVSGALADFDKAIKANPQYADVYFKRGWLKNYRLKNRSGAIKDFQQAARLYREQGLTSSQSFKIVTSILEDLGATE